MSVNLGTVYTEAELRLTKFNQQVEEMQRKFGRLGERLKAQSEKMKRDIGKPLEDIGSTLTKTIALPLAALGVAAVKSAADLDSLKRGLVAVSGSSAEAERQFKRLREVAKLPGLGMEEAVKGSVRLQAAGLSAQLAERSLKAFGNAIATVGGGKAELDGVALALGQIASKGKVYAEEINQINERVPQIRKAMEEAFGTSNTEMLQKAGLSAREFIEGVVAVLEKQKQVAGGAKNTFENLQDTIKISLAELGNVILPHVTKMADGFAAKLEALTGWFKQLNPEAQEGIIKWAAWAAGLSAGALVVGKLVTGIAELVSAITLLKATTAVPIILKISAVIGAAYALSKVVDEFRKPAQREDRFVQGGAPVGLRAGDAGRAGKLQYLQSQARARGLSVTSPQMLEMAKQYGITAADIRQGVFSEVPLPPEAFQGGRTQQSTQTDLDRQIQSTRDAIMKRIAAANKPKAKKAKVFDPFGLKVRRMAKSAEQQMLEASGMMGITDPLERDLYHQELLNQMYGPGGAITDQAPPFFPKWMPPRPSGLRMIEPSMDLQEERARLLYGGMGNLRYYGGLGQSAGASAQYLSSVDALHQRFMGTPDPTQILEMINKTALPGLNKDRIDEQSFKKQFEFIPDLFRNLADEAGNAFYDGLNNLFGKNPFGRALAKSLSRALDSIMDNAIQGMFKKKGAGGNGIAEPGGGGNIWQMLGGAALGALGAGLFDGIFKGIGKIFKFDDPVNDGRAVRWGNDFGRIFTQSAMMGSQRVTQGAGVGAVNVNAPITVYASPGQDERQIAREVAYHLQRQIPVRPGRAY